MEVWVSDGTADGTSLLRDINPAAGDALPTAFVRFRDALYFRAQDGTTGLELWKTRGTAETTTRVADLHPGTEGSIPTFPIAFRDALFFGADNSSMPGVGFDRELWRTDGTETGTTRVKDINPGPPPSIPSEIMRLGALLIFKAGNAEQGGELWKSDLTELWRTDGTAAGTTLVWQAPGRFNGYTIRGLTSVGGTLLFSAPTRADANGLASDFEPYILLVRGPRDGNDGSFTTDDDDASEDDDAATETLATINEVGLPTERSQPR